MQGFPYTRSIIQVIFPLKALTESKLSIASNMANVGWCLTKSSVLFSLKCVWLSPNWHNFLDIASYVFFLSCCLFIFSTKINLNKSKLNSKISYWKGLNFIKMLSKIYEPSFFYVWKLLEKGGGGIFYLLTIKYLLKNNAMLHTIHMTVTVACQHEFCMNINYGFLAFDI